MKTIIAEKPSVAREIARIVGATKREEGYFEGGGYAVTWAFGHLVQLAMPDGYGIRGFVRDNLPVIPDSFTLIPRQVKAEKGYKPDSGVVAQIKTITRLFNDSEQIIVATDAGREGELIFRYLYHYIGCATPFVRLWISSLTDKAIRDGLRNLEAGSKYDNLYLAAKASLPIPFPTKMPSVITNSAEKIIPSTVGSNSLRNNVLMSVFLKSILSLIFSILILFISLICENQSFPLLRLSPMLTNP